MKRFFLLVLLLIINISISQPAETMAFTEEIQAPFSQNIATPMFCPVFSNSLNCVLPLDSTTIPFFLVTPMASNDNVTVYITKTGECYYCDGCSYLRKSKISITLKETCACEWKMICTAHNLLKLWRYGVDKVHLKTEAAIAMTREIVPNTLVFAA